ncbi:spore germination protein [Paenibacillus roseipurpureus]|uniref:Spore germination protein n=1 Tax=Paenibacillus roseopurpureus TaxID=2918901 RepID=A0AA96LPS2_9BACL|nr:spore germination protein [Paenibacillus sp. MBLB1832]WNR45008.1 spore germination protein [Paenibacillus sp. MBLB1832]
MEFIRRLFKAAKVMIDQPSHNQQTPMPLELDHLANSLSMNITQLQSLFSDTPDLVIRSFTYKQTGAPAALAYLDGLVDKNSINNNVLHPLLFHEFDLADHDKLPIAIGDLHRLLKWSDISFALLNGYSVLFVEGYDYAFSLETQGWPQRAISDSQIEASLKGAHQGFIETGSQNIALIRRYISSQQLKIKELYVGERTRSKVSILYLEDVALPEIRLELERRITGLRVDCILNTGELAELIEDNPFSLFPQLITTERPDTAASQLLQGRYCVVVDRSSSVLIAPVGLAAFFQGIDDYSTRWPVATFFRLLRYFACLIAAFLPAFYIACISFNHELIPLDLILSIGEFRSAVPFPPFIEALIMEIMLEMLREAGVRLPAPIGQTVGIVGGIVIGQAAVQAGIVSNLMVVVVASTAVASFILPNFDMAASVRLIRFPMMTIASMYGIIGIMAGSMVIIAHLISLKSLGEAYSSPIAPMRITDWKDVFIRLPLAKMVKRPKSVRTLQKRRYGHMKQKGDDSS